MTGLHAGTILLSEATTETPSPFAQNMLFGFVGSVMYQYDVPQAERSTQLLSMDLEVLERLLGSTDMASLLDAEAITQVEGELAGRTFWNDLAEEDISGRVTRYAKTHGPFTADKMIAELGIDAAQAVHALDELDARGELIKGRFTDSGETSEKTIFSNGSTRMFSGVFEHCLLPRPERPSNRSIRASIRRFCLIVRALALLEVNATKALMV